MIDRRGFLTMTGAAMAATNLAQADTKLPIKKAVYYGMLPEKLSVTDRFKMAHDAGYAEVECPTTPNQADAEAMKKAAEAAGIRIHSVMNQAHWEFPLSSSDPAVVAKSMEGMKTSLHNAHFWGADTVLLVPAVVNKQTRYQDAWTRSQKQIRELLPLAEQLKVTIGIEEVWNKFLLSPLEMQHYVDEFKSPYVKAYVDVGNMVLYGYPQDWILTLNKRICKLHLKDFRWKKDQASWVNLRDGDIDWKAVYSALKEVGYNGTATVELEGGDLAYLQDVNHRVDLIFTGV